MSLFASGEQEKSVARGRHVQIPIPGRRHFFTLGRCPSLSYSAPEFSV